MVGAALASATPEAPLTGQAGPNTQRAGGPTALARRSWLWRVTIVSCPGCQGLLLGVVTAGDGGMQVPHSLRLPMAGKGRAQRVQRAVAAVNWQ